jgi:hypothetical protein
MAPILLAIVALQQIAFVHAFGLSRWKGGGFGMYSEFGLSKTQVRIEFPNGNLGVSRNTVERVSLRLRLFGSSERRISTCRDLEAIALSPVQVSVRELDFDLKTGRLRKSEVFRYPRSSEK